MADLFSIYQNLYKDDSKWNYYNVEFLNPFDSTGNAKCFIESFIEHSAKGSGSELYKKIGELKDKRIKHVVSTFFLGIHLYDKNESIKININNVVTECKKHIHEEAQKQYPDIDVDIQFSYIWFLICLFHDLGYSIEENKKKDYNDFDSFTKEYNIKYHLWEKQPFGVPAFYKNLCNKYFEYRLNSKLPYVQGIDHGVTGGIILFDDLCSILEKNSGLIIGKMYWGKKLENIFNLASWVIATHNMFYTKEIFKEKMEMYEKSGLKKLILKKGKKKIDIINHPFLYLFSLVDSIEPIKDFNEFEKLKEIQVECADNEIKVRFPKESDDYLRRFIGNQDGKEETILSDWLVSNVNKLEDESKTLITIYLCPPTKTLKSAI
jgi:hypothetical protein